MTSSPIETQPGGSRMERGREEGGWGYLCHSLSNDRSIDDSWVFFATKVDVIFGCDGASMVQNPAASRLGRSFRNNCGVVTVEGRWWWWWLRWPAAETKTAETEEQSRLVCVSRTTRDSYLWVAHVANCGERTYGTNDGTEEIGREKSRTNRSDAGLNGL